VLGDVDNDKLFHPLSDETLMLNAITNELISNSDAFLSELRTNHREHNTSLVSTQPGIDATSTLLTCIEASFSTKKTTVFTPSAQ